jgi:transposase
LPSVVRT